MHCSFKLLGVLALSSGLYACGFEQYLAKPIDQQAQVAAFYEKSPDNAAFQQFLINQGYQANTLPLKSWDLDALIDCGLFFHPSLDEARAQLRLAQANNRLAGLRPLPKLNSQVGRSDRANGDINPFSYTFSLDLPIETANKRNIRIENTTHLSEIAQLSLAQTAWQVRQQIVTHYLAYQTNQHLIKTLTAEKEYREAILQMMQKRVEIGLASNLELSLANLQVQNTLMAYHQQTQAQAVFQANLAASLGLSSKALSKMHIQVIPLDDAVTQHVEAADRFTTTHPNIDEIQTAALIHRLDLRMALAQYALAESNVKLEIARQYPDLVLSPGYAYEFGDKVWSLGLAGLMSFIHKNKLPIASAKALRDVEATKFNRIQNTVINEVTISNAGYRQAHQTLTNQQQLFLTQQKNYALMDKKFSVGEIDRVELNYAQLEMLASEKNLALANANFMQAQLQLENTLQVALKENLIETLLKNNLVRN